MNHEFSFAHVSRESIDKLLRGEIGAITQPLESMRDLKMKGSSIERITAVFRAPPESHEITRPCLMAIPAQNMRDQLAWITAYQSGFSPVSQWCRIIDPEWISGVGSFRIEGRLGGLDAAWAGATIGEIIARRGVDLSEISLIWCLSSATFAFARATALWPEKISPDQMIDHIHEARSLLKAEPRRELKGLSNVWRILLAVQNPSSKAGRVLQGAYKAILAACNEIRDSGRFSGSNASLLAEYCEKAKEFSQIDEMNAEDRVRLIDAIIPDTDVATENNDQDSIAVLSFLVGYAIGRVGAGEGNLQLLLPFNQRLPLASVWCPAITGLHQPIPWSSALDGLGRLVVNEITKPINLDQYPSSDICIEELRTIMKPNVEYKRLPFRAASSRAVLIELFPGVELAVNIISELHGDSSRYPQSSSLPHQQPDDVIRLVNDIRKVLSKYERPKPKRKSTTKRRPRSDKRQKEPKLPLDE